MAENVADYPRPPRLVRDRRRIRVLFAGTVLVDTNAAWRVLERFHPPTFYLPIAEFAPGSLVETKRTSACEWKGLATYFDVAAARRVARGAAWGYKDPAPGFEPIRDHVALYAGPMDECLVGGERALPQPGGFYGGWITGDVAGPFKGGPGTIGW